MSDSARRPFGRASIGEIEKFQRSGNVAALADLLDDPEVQQSERLRYEIATALYMVRDPRGVPSLRRLAAPDVGRKPRLLALAGLADLADRETIPVLVSALSDPEVNARLHAVRGLGNTGSNDAIVPLIGSLEDPSGAVRVAAARGLARLRDPVAIDPIARAVRSTKRPLLRLRLRDALTQLRESAR